MPACAACNNKPDRKAGISFHLFPFKSHPEIAQQWVSNLARENWTPSAFSYLCSDHFETSCFDLTGRRVRLKDGQVPTKFDVPLRQVKVCLNRRPPKKPDAPSQQLASIATEGSEPCSQAQLFHAPSSPTRAIDSLPPTLEENGVPCTYLVTLEHHYYESPRRLKRKLLFEKKKHSFGKKKLKLALQTARRLKKKVHSLSEIVDALKQKRLLSDNAADVVEKTFSGVPQSILLGMLENYQTGRLICDAYPPALRSFALTLQFYSTKAYDYVRKTFKLSLPNVSVIRAQSTGMNGNPGFSDEAFASLQVKVEQATANNKNVPCSLMINDMSIRKDIEWDGHKCLGYVDFGTDVDEDDDLPVASEAVVFLIVSLDASWKVPVGFFLINGLSGEERANLVKDCLIRLHQVGVWVATLTCDGPSCHFNMIKCLGAELHLPNPVPYFLHPANSSLKVHVILDACHMLHLMRDTWASVGALKDGENNLIEWRFVTALLKHQESEGLRAGQLGSAQIEWPKQKTKVNLAAQTISSSVADAIEICNENLHLDEFEGSEATVKFIRTFARLFDLQNSRNPHGKGYKAPMRIANEEHWRPFTHEALEYILQLTNGDGEKMYETARKTPFIGFYINTLSVVNLFDTLVALPNPCLHSLLTYKLSQDHLELFFCAVRARGGWNNDPTVKQFISSYKRLLMLHEVESLGGNVAAQDKTQILHLTRDSIKVGGDTIDTLDVSIIRKYNLLENPTEDADHDYDAIPNPSFEHMGEYLENVLSHIGGYVVVMVENKIICDDCVRALTGDGSIASHLDFILRKSRGSLGIPSPGVIKICSSAERCFRRMLHKTEGTFPRAQNFIPALCSAVLEETVGKAFPVFPSLEEHMTDSTPDSNHVYRLIKVVAECYAKIRLHHLRKQENLTAGDMIWKKLLKLILFKHQ